MKIWFNKVNESRRSVVESEADEVYIGRDETNNVAPDPAAATAS